MHRRSFLKRTSIGVAGITVLAGCSSDSGSETDHETEDDTDDDPGDEPEEPSLPEGFDRVENVVDHGADPSGEESLNPVLESMDPEGVLVYLPPGRYRMDDSWKVEGFERIAVVGEDATIVPDPGTDTFLFSFNGRARSVETRIEGLTFDYDHSDAGGRMLHLKARDGLLVRDVTATGTVKHGPSLVRVDVTESDGEGLVERLHLPDGATLGSGITGCYVGNDNRGNLTFRNCRIAGFPDNGLYADPPAGRITVDGGFFANCGISSVRIRGDSIIRNATVRCDDASREFNNMRGIRLTDYQPQDTPEPAVVENCRVDMLEVTHSDGAIELSSQLARAIVRNTRVRIDTDDVPAFNAKRPDSTFDDLGIKPNVDMENVTIEGSAGGGEAMAITGRNECVFDGLDIRQTGPNRGGISFNRSTDNVGRNTQIDVTGEAIVLANSETETFDVDVVEQHDGSR